MPGQDKYVPDNESELLRRVATGDEAAFRLLVYGYHARLKGFVYNMTHSHEQTEEVVQDVFLKIWMARESLQELNNFQTFLYVITRNLAINAMRTTIRQRVRHAKWLQGQPDEIPEADTEHDDLLNDLLDEAIKTLPPQQQTAWLLSRRNGLKYEQIAEQMNLSRETVKRHISLANTTLTKYIRTRMDMWVLIACYLKKYL